MERLLAEGRTVMLETGGHRPIDRVPDRVIKIVDVKCPGSGESDRNDWSNLAKLAPHDEVKFVIRDRADYEFARDVTRAAPAGIAGHDDSDVARPRRARAKDTIGMDAH